MTAWWPGPRRPHLQTVTKMWVQLESREMVLRIRGCGVGGLGGGSRQAQAPCPGVRCSLPCPPPGAPEACGARGAGVPEATLTGLQATPN